MRAGVKVALFGLLLSLGLVLTATPTHGQSAVFPTGSAVVFGKGILPHQIVNVPIDPSNSIVPVPGQRVGFFMPALRKLMLPPRTNGILGTSVAPSAAQFPGAVFPQFAPATAKK